MNEIIQSPSSAIVTPLNLVSLLPEWENVLESRVEAQEISSDTAKGYRVGVARFLTWLQQRQPNPATIRTWKAELLAKHKPSAVNAWLAGVRSFFGWLAEQGEIPFNPTQAIKGATRKGTSQRHKREPLTNAEVRAVLRQPDRTTPEGIRDYAILTTMLHTAARTVEIHRADLADLRTENNRLILAVQGKGRTEKDEILVIPGEAEAAVMEWIANRGQHPGPLFTSFSDRSAGGRLARRTLRRIVKDYLTAAGVTGNKTTHSLRHTAITSAIRNGADLIRTKAMSRHASTDTLMIYFHEVDRTANPAEDSIKYND